MAKLFPFIARHWLPVTGLVLATVVALWFSVSFVREIIYFNDPRHQNEPLKRWMTPRYVGMSYGLPKEVVFDLFELEENPDRRRRIGRIAEDMGLSIDELNERVREAAVRFHATKDKK